MGARGAGSVTGVTLDAGALLGLERQSARITALLDLARRHGRPVHVPAAVVAQVWRGGPRSAPVARLLNSPDVTVIDLDDARARAVGLLLAGSGTSDVVDAAVVVCAREHGDASVVTSDPDDLRRLDPTLRLVAL